MPFSFLLLNALSGAVFPAFLAGFLHLSSVALIEPGALPAVAGAWMVALAVVLGLSFASWTTLVRQTAAGRFDRTLRRIARKRFERNRRRTMIEDSEFVAAYAPVRWSHGPGVLLLTDSRLVFLAFRRFRRTPQLIADCDRLAIKSFSVRERMPGLRGWLRGARYGRDLILDVIGVSGLQVFECIDHGSVDTLVKRLAAQPKLPPVQNGIRRIHYLRHRKVLKRAYVRGFHPTLSPGFVSAGLLSLLWPGLGQLFLSRPRTGLLLAGGFAVLVYVAVATGAATRIEPGLLVAGVLIWMLGVLDVLVQRQIGLATEPGDR